jgi:hypothetical protein
MGKKHFKRLFTRSMSKDRRSITKQRLIEEQQKECTINKEILSNENLLKDKQSLNDPNP